MREARGSTGKRSLSRSESKGREWEAAWVSYSFFGRRTKKKVSRKKRIRSWVKVRAMQFIEEPGKLKPYLLWVGWRRRVPRKQRFGLKERLCPIIILPEESKKFKASTTSTRESGSGAKSWRSFVGVRTSTILLRGLSLPKPIMHYLPLIE